MTVDHAMEQVPQPRSRIPPLPESVLAPPSHGYGPTLQVPSNSSHGNVLADETSDDNDFTIDEDLIDADDIASNADAGSIIGVSIGQTQSLMKSPATPATKKVQALESSRNYFATENDVEDQLFEEPLEKSSSVHIESPESTEPVPTSPSRKLTPSPLGDKRKNDKRSSLVGSILGSSSHKPRQRSSSGSLWLDSIRKMLPSMPSIAQGTSTTNEKPEQKEGSAKVLGPAGPGTVKQTRSPLSDKESMLNEGNLSPTSKDVDSTSGASSLHHSENSENREPPRPRPLRRVTSDQSLYIRRAPTGASQFDDYNNFSDVSEMVNSRFKAITDSLQDSSLRMPRMPNMSWGDRDSAETKRNNATASNTKANTGVSRAETLESTRNKDSRTSHETKSSRHPMIKEALSQMTGDLVILGGYRGSILREAQTPHRQLWVPVKVGLNLRKADLEVGLSREDELKMEETIIPDGTLSHIGPVDICRRLIKKCRKCPNVKDGKLRVHDYGYDWRLSPDLLADRYIAFLESLPCNQKHLPPSQHGAWIIAHSMGGLITRHVINRRPELFAGVVYAGTPQNCVNILGPLRNGDDVLFSSRVLTAQVNFTIRTSYALLPENGRCFINKHTKERYDLDFFDVRTWDEYRLSPCIKAAMHRPKPDNKRLSILTNSSDSYSSSISSRYNSWFNKNDTDEDLSTSNKSPPSKLKDKAVNAKDEIADTAENATAQNKPDGPLSPNLSDGQHSRPSVATTVTIPLPAATEYLSRTLTSILHFKQSLVHNLDLQTRNAYPPLSVLFAKNTPTVYGAFVESREAIKYDDAFDELAFAAGDGVVLASAAQLPVGYRCVRGGRVESERGHVGLLGDIEGVGRCLLAVIEARRRGVGTGGFEVAGKVVSEKVEV